MCYERPCCDRRPTYQNQSMQRSKPTLCKTCAQPCQTGKRGLCDLHYAQEQREKEQANKKKQAERAKQRRAKAVQKRRESIPVLKRKLDEVFSKFIRLRDTNEDGVGYCIDCGARMTWEHVQCGHFMVRERMSTRWNEQNCAGQRDGCNMEASGRQYEMGLGLDSRYGKGTADSLVQQSLNIRQWTPQDLMEMILDYREKVNELLKTKNFQPWQK